MSRRLTEITALQDCRGAFLRELTAQADDGNCRRSRGGRQPKIDGLQAMRDKSLHQGTIQRIRLGAMDGWKGILPSRKPQRVDPVPATDQILAAAQGLTWPRQACV